MSEKPRNKQNNGCHEAASLFTAIIVSVLYMLWHMWPLILLFGV